MRLVGHSHHDSILKMQVGVMSNQNTLAVYVQVTHGGDGLGTSTARLLLAQTIQRKAKKESEK